MEQMIALELEDSVEKLTAGSVVARMFMEIDKIAEPSVPDEAWFTQMLEVIRFSQDIETGFGHTKAYALALIKDHWEELPFALRMTYGLNFITFARSCTGKEESTIRNYINTAKVWFIDKVKPEGTLSIKIRDAYGKPVMNELTGQPRTKTVEFDPYTIDMSKLLLVNSKASKGEMTPKLWELLTDSFYSCQDLQKELRNKEEEETDFYYFVEGPGLFLRNGPFVICIAEELNWYEYEHDPKTKEGMDRFFSMLGINVHADSDGIYEAEKEMYDKGHLVRGAVLPGLSGSTYPS